MISHVADRVRRFVQAAGKAFELDVRTLEELRDNSERGLGRLPRGFDF